MSVEVRLERPEDAEAAIEVERAAFGSDEEVVIVEAVRGEPGSFGLVAVEDGSVIGHVQFSRAWVGETPVLALGPIGVEPSRQGVGVGSALIEAGLREAADRGVSAVVLLGDPAYYGRFGFGAAARLGLRNPFTGVKEDGFVIEEEDFMIAVLDDRARELVGQVRWHPTFG